MKAIIVPLTFPLGLSGAGGREMPLQPAMTVSIEIWEKTCLLKSAQYKKGEVTVNPVGILNFELKLG